MNWLEAIMTRIELEKMDIDTLWQQLKEQHRQAFKQHLDATKDQIVFGDAYNCGYATFESQTGNLIINEFSPYWNPGENVADIYEYQNSFDVFQRMNFSPRKLWNKYQDMRSTLLPVCDLFLNQESVDMDCDAKPNYSRATYRLTPDEYAIRNIDAIYTAESVDDDVLKEVLHLLNYSALTNVMSLKKAQKLVADWTVTFGNHKLILLCIPSGTDDPNGYMFPYFLRQTLNRRYGQLHKNDEEDS